MKQQTISEPNMTPSAHICINKSRMKIYNKESFPTYYLSSGTEFSIELANPTTDVILAKITLNGKLISQGGLVLNPGQRVYLDRYLDVAKKFLFDTYEVSGSEEMKKAIADNGDIKVEFYRERQPFTGYFLGNSTITIGNDYQRFNSNPFYGQYNTCGGTGTFTTPTANGISGSLSLTGTLSTNGLVNSSYTSSASGADFKSFATQDSLGLGDMNMTNTLSDEPVKKLRMKSSLFKKSIETGRVEKGSDSDQSFKYVSKTFEYSAFHTVEYKMLPVSQKINTLDDINVKVYCTQCGSKLGKTDRFCSQCGKKN